MTKRGADDFVPQLNALVSPVMTVDSEAKKAKLDPTALLSQYYSQMNGLSSAHLLAGPPLAQIAQTTMCASSSNGQTNNPPRSRVVHVRNIPPDMIDVELIQLCLPYGTISNYMMLKGKSQAFVEFDDDTCAFNFVNSMTAVPIQVRGRTIFAQFSTHQELKMDKDKRKDGDEQPLSYAEAGTFLIMTAYAFSTTMASTTKRAAPRETAVQAKRMAAQVLPETYPNFETFRTDQAMSIPLQNGASASTLDISGGTQQQPNSVLRVIIENMVYPVTLDVLHSLFSRYGKVLRIITFNKNNTFQALVQMSESNAAQIAKQSLENQNVYNGCCTLRIDYSKLSTLNVKYNNDKSRDYTNPSLPSGEISLEQTLGLSAFPGLHSLLPTASPYSFAFGANPATAFLQQQVAGSYLFNEYANDGSSAALSPYLPSIGALAGGAMAPASAINSLRFPLNLLGVTTVVLVSNLDENKVTPDSLFTLFGVYGDVLRVKILYNKKDNALIQYSEPQQAQLALQHLDKVRWHEKVVRVAPSKHNNVQLPKEGQPDAGLTRDYSHSPLHRFKKPGSKNYMNIYPPSSTLHLSNIPQNVSEQTLTEAFDTSGYPVKAFKFFPKDHKMALLQLEDIETAIDALIHMHNHKLAENAHLRVSFSKSGI